MNGDSTNASGPVTGSSSAGAQEQAESGNGFPTPGNQSAPTDATNPGPADPTLRGEQTDAEALEADQGLGLPERNFLHDEDAGSDGEPGAGSRGGTDEQFRDELNMADAGFAQVDPADETRLEAASTDADLDDGNAGPTRPEREPFSSEPDEDSSGT